MAKFSIILFITICYCGVSFAYDAPWSSRYAIYNNTFINSFIKKHLVENTKDTYELCFKEYDGDQHHSVAEIRRRSRFELHPYQNQDVFDVINNRRGDRNVEYVTVNQDPYSAVTSYGMLTVLRKNGAEGNWKLPYFINAEIRPYHLSQPQQPFPSWVRKHLDELDMLPADDAGSLLSPALGGPSNEYNFVPMAQRLNRNANGDESMWRRIEDSIRQFLMSNPNSKVVWGIFVTYAPGLATYRPTGYCMQYKQYLANGTLESESVAKCFGNDPDFGCAYNFV